jgi:hypothetical protein
MRGDQIHRRAFVIQLGPDSDPATGRFEGRVEHVASGASVRFARSEELLDFLARTIDAEQARRDAPEGAE